MIVRQCLGQTEIAIDLRVDLPDEVALRRYCDPRTSEICVTAGAAYPGGANWFAAPEGVKTPVVLDLYCAPGWTVIGNGPAGLIAPGHWRIQSVKPLAPHLVAFAAGDFHSVRADGASFHARPALARRLDRDAATLGADVAACLSRLETLFGATFPWPTCDFVFVPDLGARALEYPGCVQLSEALLPGTAHTAATRAERLIVLAHELTHMWFGNLVTPRVTRDVWFYEAVAEHLGQRIAAQIAGSAVVSGPIARRQLTGCRAALHNPAALADSDVPVSRVGYVKGAAAIAELRRRLGDSGFIGGLRSMVGIHRDGVASVDELIAVWPDSVVRPWRRDWFDHRGIDVVTAGGARLDSRELAVRNDERPWSYLRFDAAQWEQLQRVGPGFDPPARAMVWTALQLGVADANVEPAIALQVACAMLAAETDEMLLDAGAHWTIGVLLWRYLERKEARVRAALADAFGAAESGSGLAATAARHLIAVSEAGPLRTMLDRDGTELHWRAMVRLAALGELSAQEMDASRSASAGTHWYRYLAALPEPGAKQRAWRMITTDERLTPRERAAAARMFWHPYHRQTTAPYVRPYFAALAEPGPIAPILAEHGFPYTAAAGVVLPAALRVSGDRRLPRGIRSAVAMAVAELIQSR